MTMQRLGSGAMQDVKESREEELKELETVVEALARTPRLARLLRYMGDKYFSGALQELTEYNIATEVCGRSTSSFVAGEDAIARVEVHRLRKKLRDFYENGGRTHTIHIAIPLGTYIPNFTHRAGVDASPVQDPADTLQQPLSADIPGVATGAPPELLPARVSSPVSFRFFLTAMIVIVIAIAVVVGFFFLRKDQNASPTKDALASQAVRDAGGAHRDVVHLLAGYDGNPIRDASGDLWTSDRFFQGGGTWPRPAGFIARTSNPLLFQYSRTGDFKYDIPLAPGIYELHLFFVSYGRAENSAPATFQVSANGQTLLQGFDINADALGDDIADERVFTDVTPASDGMLHLSFDHATGVPALNAIEILPGIPHRQLPVRLVMQRTSFVDHDGNPWAPDNYYLNGALSTVNRKVTGTRDPDLFTSERYGHFSYAIPLDPRDQYTLILHFAEFYFGPQAPGGGGVGSRIFRVFCNGQTILDNFDIFREAGSYHLLTKTFMHLRPSAEGKLDLTFEPLVNNASVSAIEVLDEGR
jgi:hypothetical protein